jgi:hypothetical protein
MVLAALPIAWTLGLSGYPGIEHHRRATEKFEAAADLIRAHVGSGCLYLYEGPVHLYDRVGSCRLTRFVFPEHLNSPLETDGIGTDQAAELRRVIEQRPTVIVTTGAAAPSSFAPSFSLLARELRRRYRLVGVRTVTGWRGDQDLHIWALAQPGEKPPSVNPPGSPLRNGRTFPPEP